MVTCVLWGAVLTTPNEPMVLDFCTPSSTNSAFGRFSNVTMLVSPKRIAFCWESTPTALPDCTWSTMPSAIWLGMAAMPPAPKIAMILAPYCEMVGC